MRNVERKLEKAKKHGRVVQAVTEIGVTYLDYVYEQYYLVTYTHPKNNMRCMIEAVDEETARFSLT